MSDAATPATTEGTTGQSAIERDSMTPERLASARATWAAAGHDVGRFDAEYGLATAAPVTPTTPAPPELGQHPAPAVPPLAQDTRTEAQREWDHNMGMDRQWPAEAYHYDPRAAGLAHQSTEALVASRETWRALGVALQLQPGLYNDLIETFAIPGGQARAKMSASYGLRGNRRRH